VVEVSEFCPNPPQKNSQKINRVRTTFGFSKYHLEKPEFLKKVYYIEKIKEYSLYDGNRRGSILSGFYNKIENGLKFFSIPIVY